MDDTPIPSNAQLDESFSSNHSVYLPGDVDQNGKDGALESSQSEPSPSMNKVFPGETDQQSPGTFAATGNHIMENADEQMTTSFSNQSLKKYDAMLEQEKQIASLMHDPSRGDSLHQVNDLRLENIDFTDQSLHQIARDGDTYLMKAVLNHLPRSRAIRRLNRKDKDQFMPLHYAARYNHFDMCQLLLQRGANLHARGEDAMTSLHLVAKYKPKKERLFGAGDGDKSDVSSEDDAAAQEAANLNVLSFLISSGARVNEKDFYGLTPLHHAALRGNSACAAKLLECQGIAIEATDKQAMTPLHICAIYGHVDIAKLLIGAGANFRCKDSDDGTPLQFAAAEGNLEFVELIFSQCEDNSQLHIRDVLDEKDNDGNTPLHLAVDNGHLPMTQYIIEQCLNNNYGAALNVYRSNKETPLHIAARHGSIEIAKLLVEKGAKVNARNDNLQTPLFLAAQFNHSEVVEFLIKCGAVVESHDTDSYTALLIAANYGHTETISVLLRYKANVMAVDKNDKTVIYMCAEEDRADALQELLKRKKVLSLLEVPDRYDNTPLHAAAINGHFAIIKILVEAGSVVDAKNEDEQTPLHLAAQKGFVKIVKELIKKRPDIVHDDDESANTALHLAALSGREHCVRELVRLGANIEARNAKQWTPLDCCASAGMHKCALVLLEADSPVDPKDKRKITPLHLACRNGHTRTVELLIQWNADVTQRSVRGLNALDFAIENSQTDCAEAIINSDRWREALHNRSLDYASDQHIDTPMRKLIRRMPSVAEQVFRKCLRDNGRHKDDPRYEISFDYEFLDDEFTCTGWKETNDNAAEINVSGVETNLLASNEVYDDNGKLLEDAVPYSTDSSILMANHPLYVMVKSKRVSLMRHPLVISLLNHKWRAYGRAFYYTNLIIYMCFMASLNSYMLTVPPPYAILRNETIPGSCVRVRVEAQGVWGSGCTPAHAEWQPIARYLILVLASFGLLKEFYQLFTKRISYIKSITNSIEMSLYVLSVLLVIDITTYAEQTGIREDWQWQCGAAALFLSWMELLLFIQNFPRFGIFVLMFGDVLRTFISFFFVFVLFILGFAFSFHVLLQNQFAFSRWWNSIVKTFVMMIGEFEYEGIFNSEFTSNDYTSQLQYEAIMYILFVVFMIIMSIIIMNLLVGLAVDDIKAVQDNAVLESLAMQVKLALDIEYTLPRFVRRGFMKKYRKFRPNQYRKSHWLAQWYHSEEHLNHQTLEEALNPEKTELQAMDEKIDILQTKVRDMRGQVYGLMNRSQQISNITQAIANHFNIDWEKDEDDQEVG